VAKRQLTFAVTVAVFGAALTGAVLATSGYGVLSGTVVARAGFVDPTDIKFKIDGGPEEVVLAPNAQETVMQQIVIGPGGHTGWHSHPGPVVVLIKTGALTFYSGDDPACTPRTYSAGQAFVDSGQGHVHIARNLSTTDNLELWATYFDVPPGGAFRIDVPDPGNCTF
jgi:quercetin dioxygenase-like cupin family protein